MQEEGYEYKKGKLHEKEKGKAGICDSDHWGKIIRSKLFLQLFSEKKHDPKSRKQYLMNAVSKQIHQKSEMAFLIDIQAKIQEGNGCAASVKDIDLQGDWGITPTSRKSHR